MSVRQYKYTLYPYIRFPKIDCNFYKNIFENVKLLYDDD